MIQSVDPESGEVEVFDSAVDALLVPLNIADLDEDQLLALFPTPVQAAGALIIARGRLRNAPAYLNAQSAALRAAKRDLIVAKGYARERLRAAGYSWAESKDRAEADAAVIKAIEQLDTCELAREYAQDLKWMLSKEVDILRSLNTNFREEHK